MDEKTDKEQRKVLRLLLAIMKPVGIVIFTLEGRNLVVSRTLKFLNFIRILLFIPASVFIIWNRILWKGESVLMKTTDVIQVITIAMSTVGIWICSLTTCRQHIDFIHNIQNFDKAVTKITQTKIHMVNCKKLALIRLVCLIVSITGQTVSYTYASDVSAYLYYITFYTAYVVNSLFCHLVVTYIGMIRVRFKLLNTQLSKLLRRPSVPTIYADQDVKPMSPLLFLNHVCHLHHLLTRIVKLMNALLGFCLMTMLIVAFVNTVIGLYYCSTAFQQSNTNWKVIFNNILLSVFSCADILIICHMADYTIQAAKKSGVLIHKIETNDYDMKDQIEMFSLQIANERIEFNAAGFFPINYTLVFSIVGGVTTYIIILIQLAANKSINP